MSAFVPMLAESGVWDRDVERYVHDPAWSLSWKVDGRRLIGVVDSGDVAFLNRRGEPVDRPPPATVRREFERIGGGLFAFDGELLPNGELWLFDLIVAGGHVTPATPLLDRYRKLDVIVGAWQPEGVRILPLATTVAAKRSLVERVVRDNGEGLVAKRLDSPYVAERSRAWVKLKRTRTVDTFVVDVGRDGKRSMVLGVYDADGSVREVADCTMLAGDGPRCRVGDVVEVTCLYVGANGRLVQPTSPRLRTGEKAVRECTADQLEPLRVNRAVPA